MSRMGRRPEIHVVAGAMFDAEGRVLLAQRPVGKHMAGRWEFPGGKLQDGESAEAGLRRELAEELGVELGSAERLIRISHDYPDRRVLLDVWQVTAYSGEPRGLDAQALDWVAPDRLPAIDLLEADRPIIAALRLPRIALSIGGLDALDAVGAAGRRRRPCVLFWDPDDADPAAEATREAVRAARRQGHKVIVAGGGVEAIMAAASTGADGLLLTGGDRMSVDPRGSFMVGEVCPTPAAARAAAAAGAHFVVVAPAADAADEQEFTGLLAGLGVPAYLGWYADARSLSKVRSWGAHGCAVAPPGSGAG